MKKLFTYIAPLLLLASCSSEVTLVDDYDEQEEVKGIVAEIKDPVLLGDEFISRSSLVYDDVNRIMEFKWDKGDCIGVFTCDPEHSQQQTFSQVEDPNNNDDHLRTFKTQDGYLSVTPGQNYVSHFPYIAASDYTHIPIDYTGQKQTASVDFSDYKKTPDTRYKKSQPLASAHLSNYDFMCTGPITPTAGGGIHFPLTRMGAIVRFWLVIGKQYKYVYDELMLVNNAANFTTTATMDAELKTLTATATSHILTLKLGDEGFDMSVVPAEGVSNAFYYWNPSKNDHQGYIQAYMMVAPIDLTGDDVESCVLYLVAHEKNTPENKHYFKSIGLSKPNLQPNTFYQWTVTPGEDTPIEFQTITVEEWREGTSFENGGKGTGSW